MIGQILSLEDFVRDVLWAPRPETVARVCAVLEGDRESIEILLRTYRGRFTTWRVYKHQLWKLFVLDKPAVDRAVCEVLGRSDKVNLDYREKCW